MFYQHLKAPNDKNGNPRRLYVLYKHVSLEGLVCRIFDEGYAGKPTELRDVPEIQSLEITPAKYRELRKQVHQ